MELTVLLGNNVFHSWYSECGLSFYIEEGSAKILFDLGSSNLFIRNSCQLKCDLLMLDYLVISHGHWDHSMKYLKEVKPMAVHACQYIDPNAKLVLSKVINMKEVG